MIAYYIWGRIEHIGPHQFFTIASAVPMIADSRSGVEPTLVETRLSSSLDAAGAELEALVRTVGAEIVARGHQIVDVEVEWRRRSF